jgi:hypothetical protein
VNANLPCPFEDLPPSERRLALCEPNGMTHASHCDSCSTFTMLDVQLRRLAAQVPGPPALARWAYTRARWVARNEASEHAAFCGDLVAKLLALLGGLGALGLFVRALRSGADAGGMGGPELGSLVAVIGGAAISSVLLSAVYRAWSEP